jgi:hypothetical protein
MKKPAKTKAEPVRMTATELMKEMVKGCAGADLDRDKRPMGLGKLADPKIVFARKFRWTMESQGLPESYAKNVTVDYMNKRICFAYYDIFDEANPNESFHALRWVAQLSKNTINRDIDITLTTYDGCGKRLYTCVFKGITLKQHYSSFDYASSDVSCQQITVGFQDHEIFTHTPEKGKGNANAKRKRKKSA